MRPAPFRKLLMIALFILLPLLALALPRWWAGWRYSGRILRPDEAPRASAAVVFGAGLRRDGRPTTVLADRVRMAAQLFHDGKVPLLVMSGTVREGYDEPGSMRELALSLGVPEDAIQLDTTGDRTFETCLAVRRRFTSGTVLLVSQTYHLPRALATCAGLGVDASGIAADLRVYRTSTHQFWLLREYPATWGALLDTYIFPLPDPAQESKSVERQPPHGS
jgi:SanA protein